MKVNAQLKAANMQTAKDEVGGRINVGSLSPGKRKNRQPSLSFLKSQATSLGLHNESMFSKSNADQQQEPSRTYSNPRDSALNLQENSRTQELETIEEPKPKVKKTEKKNKKLMLNQVSSDSLINVIPTELQDHIELAKKVQNDA